MYSLREWMIDEEIGQGGFGVVYRAEHTLVGGEFAIKMIRPEQSDDELFRQRFLSEASIMSGLSHPNIVDTQVPFEEDGRLFLPMKLLDGPTLKDLFDSSNQQMPAKRTLNVVHQIGNAVGFLHNMSPPILHRDLKPGNIFLLDGDDVQVVDFGLARVIGDQSLTITGSLMGTPMYLPPEVLDGERPTAKSDIYAIGVIFYRMLTGRLPFEIPAGDSSMFAVFRAVFQAHEDGITPVSDIVPSISGEISELVSDCLNGDETKRPKHGYALIQRIEDILETMKDNSPQESVSATTEITRGIETRADEEQQLQQAINEDHEPMANEPAQAVEVPEEIKSQGNLQKDTPKRRKVKTAKKGKPEVQHSDWPASALFAVGGALLLFHVYLAFSISSSKSDQEISWFAVGGILLVVTVVLAFLSNQVAKKIGRTKIAGAGLGLMLGLGAPHFVMPYSLSSIVGALVIGTLGGIVGMMIVTAPSKPSAPKKKAKSPKNQPPKAKPKEAEQKETKQKEPEPSEDQNAE